MTIYLHPRGRKKISEEEFGIFALESLAARVPILI